MTFPAEIFAKLPKAGESETELLKKMNAPAKSFFVGLIICSSRMACQVKTCECFSGKVIEVPLME